MADWRARQTAAVDWQDWTAQLDRYCSQFGSVHCGLFWHRDLDMARERAAASGRPILSLRLLGNLDEELSCANSRFFRRVLYADPRVATIMRQRFVLHWSSERPAPRLSLDFGDGRRLETTLTGNSVHYVLDAQGHVVDGLPGLVTPTDFIAFLEDARVGLWTPEQVADGGFGDLMQVLPADRAQLMTTSKRGIELTPQGAIAARARTALPQPERNPLFANLTAADIFAEPVRDLISADLQRTDERAGITLDVPASLDAFARRVASDSHANTGFLQPRLRAMVQTWWRHGGVAPTLEAVNRRVYDELLATPRADPWMGLLALGYAGLSDGGVRPTLDGASLSR